MFQRLCGVRVSETTILDALRTVEVWKENKQAIIYSQADVLRRGVGKKERCSILRKILIWLKKTEMRWSLRGDNAVARLRTLYLYNLWDAQRRPT